MPYRAAFARCDRGVLTALLVLIAAALVARVSRVFDDDARARLRVDSSLACGRARGRRRSQEDAVACAGTRRGVTVVAVFDGHDGSGASECAARRAARGDSWLDVERLARSLDAACGGVEDSGTTAVIASVSEEGWTVAHVGDSAAYACAADARGRWRARRVTEDHGLGNAKERERLKAQGAVVKVFRGKLRVGGEFLVTRALGGARWKALGVSAEPSVASRLWRSDEVGLLLASDGTMERLKADDACAFVFAGKRDCDGSKSDVPIALGGEAGTNVEQSQDAWDAVEVQGNSQTMREGIERALKCALDLGSTDNVALAAVSARRGAMKIETPRTFQRGPSNLVAETPRLGSTISAYKITELVAWSSGPYLPADVPFRDDAYYTDDVVAYNFRGTFQQSAIEGALAALALAPGTSEKNRVHNAIASYVGIIDPDARTRKDPFARGHFGEVWRATMSQAASSALECPSSGISGAFSTVIMKRILAEKNLELQLSADREVYFGRLLCGASAHIARYMHTFERTQPTGIERWLVFRDEGESLERLLYASDGEAESTGLQLVTQSEWWREMRETVSGRHTLKTILRHIFTAVNVTHSSFGVVHRDIKPANVFVRLDGDIVEARLGDFGSAMDTRRRVNLYAASGPSSEQETAEYSPPEVLFGNDQVDRTFKYDMWSLGVMMTEILALGSPKAFSHISRKTRLALERELRDVHPTARAVAYRLRAMLELCIVPPDTQVAPLLSWECTETALMDAFKVRDPLQLGFESVWTLRLVRKLLSWDPSERPSAARSLEHAFFRDGDERGWTCVGDANAREYEWKSDCEAVCAAECT